MKDNLFETNRLIRICIEKKDPKLNLSKRGLNNIDDISELLDCTHLQNLDLSSNQFTDISFLEKLIGLQTLILDNNQISDCSFLGKLTGLQSLDLSANQISDISSLEKLTGLQTLILNRNQISDISSLEKLTMLEFLSLWSNQITDICFLEKLTRLQSLDLWSNHISNISFLEKLTGLQSLDLGSNKISDFSFLEKLPGLKSLVLISNEIKDCSFLEKMIGLQILKLGNNQISDISFFEKLTDLQTLEFSSSEISDFSFLEKLPGLRSLTLNNNHISDFSFLEKLTGLHTLYLNSNQISDISFLENQTGLQNLSLEYNQISDISLLKKLTRLRYLKLGSNQIKDFSFLEKLTKLQTLHLNSNQISNISFLEKLKELQSINLSDNIIKELPSWTVNRIYKITHEKYDWFDGFMNLNNNPLTNPPIEIVKQGHESIREWFQAKRKTLNEIKIILLGDPKAGKTSLLRRLKDDTFNKDEVQTDGINIENIKFGVNPTFIEQTSLHQLTGHFWDFGGQEIMNATHQFFLTNRSVYVLVLDARKDKNVATQIRQWVKRIKTSGGNSPIIIVSNQIDINKGFGFENEYDLQKEFPQIKCFIKVSCLTGENIDLIKMKLEELIPFAELFKSEIDERWISLKDQLETETMEDKFINETRFLQICEQHGLTKNKEQKYAINFLHDLGIVLHFEVEDKSLSEYYVLDPYWITYGVYQILTSKYAAESKGKVSMSKLNYIVNVEEDKEAIYQPSNLKRIKYSNNERRFLVDILNQFKLCFFLPDRNHFILPDLLDTLEPNELTFPIREAEDNIRFVYEYGYLSKSTMPFIMVETHRIVVARWRTGCIICNNGCKALISSYENRLIIIVTGEYKQKREFLSIIRFMIDLINKDLNDSPNKLIPLPDNFEFADYDILLEMEKEGKTNFDIYKPKRGSFKISALLEGISSQSEVDKIGEKLDVVLKNQEIIIHKIDVNYDYIISKLGNEDFAGELSVSICSITTQKNQEISSDVISFLTEAFVLLDQEMDEKFKRIFEDLKKSDNTEVKLKLGIPLIQLLGIDFEAKFDVKNWAKEMYRKYELRIFEMMGYL